jgi:AcrR family transcriptional regulator
MGVRVERGQATREHVIATATKLFATQGYDASSIEQVLQETGVSRGALYHHFKSKDALFEAVLENVEARIAASIAKAAAGAASAEEALRRGCAAWLRIADDPEAHRITLIDAPAVLGWERWREIDARHAFGLLKRGLEALAAERRLRADLVEPMAHMLLAALLEATLVVARAPDRSQARRTAEAAVTELLDKLLA